MGRWVAGERFARTPRSAFAVFLFLLLSFGLPSFGQAPSTAQPPSLRVAGQPPCPHEYSNLGFGILGVVLEIAYGKPWAALVQEKIAGPLGMADTVQELSPAQQSRFAEPWSGEERAHPWTFQAIAGAGSLRSSLADMSKLADALLAGAKGPLGAAWLLLAGDYVDLPAAGAKIGLALLHAKDHGEDSYFHEGETGGYHSFLYVRPASGRAVVLLASNAAASPVAWLAAWEAAGRPPIERSEVVLPGEALEEYVGVYPIDKTARFTLLRRGDGLVARLTGQPFFPACASAKDEFFYKVVDAQLSFHRDAAGRTGEPSLAHGAASLAHGAASPAHGEASLALGETSPRSGEPSAEPGALPRARGRLPRIRGDLPKPGAATPEADSAAPGAGAKRLALALFSPAVEALRSLSRRCNEILGAPPTSSLRQRGISPPVGTASGTRRALPQRSRS